MGKLGGSTRGAEHDSISVLSISVLLLLDGVRAGDEVRLMLRREARRGRKIRTLDTNAGAEGEGGRGAGVRPGCGAAPPCNVRTS